VSALTQTKAEEIAVTSGCHAAQVLILEGAGVGGQFRLYGRGRAVVRVATSNELPDSAFVHILLHEIAHCLQYQSGEIYRYPTIVLEQDADVIGANLGCRLGYGYESILALYAWALANGYTGDRDHGTIVERWVNVQRFAHDCRPVAQAA